MVGLQQRSWQGFAVFQAYQKLKKLLLYCNLYVCKSNLDEVDFGLVYHQGRAKDQREAGQMNATSSTTSSTAEDQPLLVCHLSAAGFRAPGT